MKKPAAPSARARRVAGGDIVAQPAAPQRFYRFHIQRLVPVKAQTKPDVKPVMLGGVWRTIGHADHQAAGETILKGHRQDDKQTTFRLAEQPAPGAAFRTLL